MSRSPFHSSSSLQLRPITSHCSSFHSAYCNCRPTSERWLLCILPNSISYVTAPPTLPTFLSSSLPPSLPPPSLPQLVHTSQDVHNFLSYTLLSTQHNHDYLIESCDHILSQLVAMGYVAMETSSSSTCMPSKLQITALGRATYKGDEKASVGNCLIMKQSPLALRLSSRAVGSCDPPGAVGGSAVPSASH